LRGRGERVGQLLTGGTAAVYRDELLAGLVDVALPAAQRARGPVLAAELVEHRAVDAGPRVLLERRALLGVVAVDRGDQRLEAAGDEVIDLAARRELADLVVDDVLHERSEREHDPIAELRIVRLPVLLPKREGLLVGHALPALGIQLHRMLGAPSGKAGRGLMVRRGRDL